MGGTEGRSLQFPDGIATRHELFSDCSFHAARQRGFRCCGRYSWPSARNTSFPVYFHGILQENDTSIGAFFCSVRNVGVVSHNVMIDIGDGGNLTDNAFANSVSLAPGHGTILTFPPHRGFTAFDACIVTTDEGTTDALEDLRL